MSIKDFDDEIYEGIQDLVDAGEIEVGTPAYGVSQQVIYNGYASLSPKQRTLYEAVVVPLLKRRGQELKMIRIDNSNHV